MDLVTGATGHIGNVLVRTLLKHGRKVRCLIRKGEKTDSLKGVDVEYVEGDITDYDSVNRACRGIDVVYHLAAVISVLPGKKKLIESVNIGGTENVIKACLGNKVERLLYVGTIHALKEPPIGQTITEEDGFDPKTKRGIYDRSKARASLAIIKAVKDKKLNAVIVCPTGVIGPYDYAMSSMGKYFLEYSQGRHIAGINGAYDFVDVRDAASGMMLAAQKGHTGEMYILSGHRITINQLDKLLTKYTKARLPLFTTPRWLSIFVAWFSPIYYAFYKQTPTFTPYSLRTLFSNSQISSEKAQVDLGFHCRPIEQSIKDHIEWFVGHGIIKKRPA